MQRTVIHTKHIIYKHVPPPPPLQNDRIITRENFEYQLYIFVFETEFELNKMNTEYQQLLNESPKSNGGKSNNTKTPHNQSSLLINTQRMKASPFSTRVTSKHNKIRKNEMKQTKYKRVR